MSMLGAILNPHPPVLLPEVGHGREQDISATAEAMRTAARQAAQWKPDVLVIASPHTILYGDYFHISPGEDAVGDMSAFGAPEVRIHVQYDTALRKEIIRRAEKAGLRAGTLGERDAALDHGVLIPLYFLRKAGLTCPIVRIGLSGFSPLAHYQLGQCVAEAAEALERRVLFVASGDLSHKLKADGPYGFAPEGPVFDQAVTEAMASGDFLQFLTMNTTLCERAAECGLRSFQMMAGALDGYAIAPTTENVAWEIVNNAISAGTRDPRFSPVRPDELSALEYSVDVLGDTEPVSSSAALDPKQYGVIVSCGSRRGLLLPDLDGIDTAEQQIDIARQKGGIDASEPYSLARFKVVRHQ